MRQLAITAAFVLAGGIAALGQQPAPAPAERDRTAATDTDRNPSKKDVDVTYGRIKELTAGKKVVIDVDDALDKDFDLTDKDIRVQLAKGLNVGDPVKVTETDKKGKKTVQIVRHTGGGVQHGDQERARTTDKPNK